jgi:beta-glucosidase
MNFTRRDFLALTGTAVAAYAAPAKPRLFAKFDPDVKKVLTTLSLDEKIGQMTQPDQLFLQNLDDIEKYHLGSLLSGGDSDPKAGNDLVSWTELYERYQKRALAAKPRIPLLYGIDAVHGNNNLIGAVCFPQNIGLGCTRNAKLIEECAHITALEMKACGVNWAFSPCLTAPQDIRWGRTYEGYSQDPAVIAPLGAAATRGLQGKSLKDPLSVVGCAKHYAGDGGTYWGTGQPKGNGQRFPLDQGDVREDEATFRKLHLIQYVPSIQAGVGTIMPSYSSWNGVKCSANKRLLTEILKEELGFEGFLISDYGALQQIPAANFKEQIAISVNAGMDMVMVPEKYVDFFNLLKENVSEGKVPQARIDDAVTRILRIKFAMGLMDPKTDLMSIPSATKAFGSAEHRAVARQAVRESQVLLKNEKKTLPLSKSAARIHVGGKCADDIGNQCGGWTITWQGKSGDTTKGTTILAGMKKAVSANTQVTFAKDGAGAEGASIGVAVIGETPYAESAGDRVDLHLAAEDVAVVENMKRAGIPVVAVIVSGRPLLLDAILNKADAILAAWLPGTEGDGVSDVLFGVHKPTGKLSFTWPSGESTSLHLGDPGYKTLYAFGHGLSY